MPAGRLAVKKKLDLTLGGSVASKLKFVECGRKLNFVGR
jgi:hypothetical protein